MRIAVLAAVGLMTVPPLVHGQDSAGWAAKLFRTEDGKVPSGHDFGPAPRGAMLRHRFPITNIYAVPLQVVTSVSCGCVTATPTPQVLQPRETGVVDVTMDTTKFNGPKSVTLWVTVYSPDQRFSSTAALTITGVCRTDVTLTPPQAEFGVVPRGQALVRDLRVSYAGPLKWEISRAAPNELTPFDVRWQEESRRPGRVDYRVYLSLKADAPAGTHRGELYLYTNDPNNPQIPIPYDVTVLAPLTVSPEVSPFGMIKAGAAAAPRKVIIRGPGKPFRIIGVDGQGEGLSVEFPNTPAAVHILTINFQPTQPGPIARTLTIRTDLDGGTVNARVTATVQQ